MVRRDLILKLIVERFIKTCEPVGSETLKEIYHLEVSSATIRSVMLGLEKEGFVEKPHASGGRVPTEKGYRYYVENLRDEGVDQAAKNALQCVLGAKSQSVEEVIKNACEILSNMTSLASAVLGQGSGEEELASIQLVPLGGNAASAVFVTNQGYVEHKTFMIDEKLGVDKVASSMKAISERLVGTPIGKLTGKMEAMKPILIEYLLGQEVLYDAIFAALSQLATERVSVYGKDELLAQPEFQDPARLRKMVEALDNPSALIEQLVSGRKKNVDGVEIALGKDDLEGLALVSANVALPGNPSVSLTLLGPQRMDYAKAMSTLRYFAEQLDRYFGMKGVKDPCQTASQKKESQPLSPTGSSTRKTSSSARKAQTPRKKKASRKS